MVQGRETKAKSRKIHAARSFLEFYSNQLNFYLHLGQRELKITVLNLVLEEQHFREHWHVLQIWPLKTRIFARKCVQEGRQKTTLHAHKVFESKSITCSIN